MGKTIYLAGPMSGIAQLNHPEFHAVALHLRQQGMAVLCPAEVDNGSTDKTWQFYMKLALRLLLDADAIALLPGWERSKGATIELELAKHLGYEIYLIDRGPSGEDVILNAPAGAGGGN